MTVVKIKRDHPYRALGWAFPSPRKVLHDVEAIIVIILVEEWGGC